MRLIRVDAGEEEEEEELCRVDCGFRSRGNWRWRGRRGERRRRDMVVVACEDAELRGW